MSDFEKINHIKLSGEYSNSLTDLLKNYPTDTIYYGIGLPFSKTLESKLIKYESLVDFVVTVSQNLEMEILKGVEIF